MKEESTFMKEIEAVRLAESEAERIKDDAKKHADEILRKARDHVLKIKNEIEEEITAFKNKNLREGSEALEKEVQHILSNARKEADKIRKARLSKKEISALFDDFLSAK